MDRYTILGAIHRGGMGEILLARVEGADGFAKKIVLKGLLPSLISDPVSMELFRREARLMARLEHPNIVRVLDFTYVNEQPYLAMEYVRGRNLHQLIQRARERGERLSPRYALHIVAEALRGIDHAHRARNEEGQPLGIIHRDVSPGNILLGFFGEVKVTDFGIATAIGARSLTGPRSIRGKARYAAPEVIRGEPATARSDLYAAGVVLAEALTGEPLWERRGVSQTLIQIVSEPRDRTLDRIFETLPDILGLRSVLRRCLALRPDDRFESAGEAAGAIDLIIKSTGTVSAHDLGGCVRRLFSDAPDLPQDLCPPPGEAPPSDFLAAAPEPRITLPSPPPAALDEEEVTPWDRAVPRPTTSERHVTGTLRPPHWLTGNPRRTGELPKVGSGPVIGGMNPPAGAIASLNASGPVIGGLNPPASAIASLNASGPAIGGRNPPAGAIASLNASGPAIGGRNPSASAPEPHTGARLRPELEIISGDLFADLPIELAPETPPLAAQPAYFSELLAAPSQTSREDSGDVSEPPMERIARIQQRIWMQNPWVLIIVGILIGAATAITGSLIALSAR